MKLIPFTLKNRWLPDDGRHGWGNGYVALPPEHPCYGMHYNEIHEHYAISVNGGLTLSSKNTGWRVDLPKEVLDGDFWIVGFDTAHSWDDMQRWPDEASVMKEAENLKQQLENLKASEEAIEARKLEKLNDAAPALLEALKWIAEHGQRSEKSAIKKVAIDAIKKVEL